MKKGHDDRRNRGYPEVLKEALGQHTIEAVEKVVLLMQTATSEQVQLKAASIIIDAFVAKAPRSINIQHQHSVADLLQQVNGELQKHDPATMIDVTPVQSFPQE